MDCFSLSRKQCRQVKRSSLNSDLGTPAQLLICAEHVIISTKGALPAQNAPITYKGEHMLQHEQAWKVILCAQE